MIRVTVDDMMSHRPCSAYPRQRVVDLWAGRESLTAREIAELGIPANDRVWALIRTCLTERQLREFACDCADRALNREREVGRVPDPRSATAVDVARRFARGEATQEELSAAYDDAEAAYEYAAASAAAYAASAAAYASSAAAYAATADAATAAYDDAAAAREWQCNRIVDIAEKGEMVS